MKQKTAIRQLIEHIETQKTFPRDTFMMSVYKKAKGLESVNDQQIIDVVNNAIVKWITGDVKVEKNFGESIFNETFEKP